ncbi:ASCH domain-containing protein [Celeribacter sp. HF31]|uniref:ASCH domain-containing protein n=1 Tax=Celeribacter sp. HF31 TaxID=2721558 RepID=UPI001430A76C|nr:ASCH domain-containing protein [Celeribacter sp. HF31]NIY80876.1 ASCH domain-containing protein [Celeribacter sp. HF31]
MTDQNDTMEDLQVTYPGAGTFLLGATKGRVEHLNKLVAAKQKTATCLPWSEFENDQDALPQVGRCDIVANWDGTPAMVVRTVSVDKVKFRHVTPQMAMAEGEDKDIEAWRKRTAKAFGTKGVLDRDTMLVFETFELVEDLGLR